jgi:O-antigen ligase
MPTAAISADSRVSLHSIEIWILAALAFCVPLFEAPKSILWGLYVVVWMTNRARSRDFGGRWDAWDTLIAAWIASGFLVATFAGLHHKEWIGALDLLRYGSILWLIKRSRYDERTLGMLVAVLVSATIVAAAWGYWQLLVTHRRAALELRSVGHVNHSAIYLAIAFGVALAATLGWWRALTARWKAAGVASVLFLGASVLVTASRGAAAAALAFAVLLAIAWWPRSRALTGIVAATVAVAIALAFVARIDVVKKQEEFSAKADVLNYRDRIWHTAVTAWRQFPLFGVGMDNYSRITLDRLREWETAAGREFAGEAHSQISSHGHSLYFNTLAERGIVGAAALAAVLLGWLGTLVRNFPGRAGGDSAWALWATALAGWFVTVVTGIANTSLHHEQAILAVATLGLWLAWLRRPTR